MFYFDVLVLFSHLISFPDDFNVAWVNTVILGWNGWIWLVHWIWYPRIVLIVIKTGVYIDNMRSFCNMIVLTVITYSKYLLNTSDTFEFGIHGPRLFWGRPWYRLHVSARNRNYDYTFWVEPEWGKESRVTTENHSLTVVNHDNEWFARKVEPKTIQNKGVKYRKKSGKT